MKCGQVVNAQDALECSTNQDGDGEGGGIGGSEGIGGEGTDGVGTIGGFWAGVCGELEVLASSERSMTPTVNTTAKAASAINLAVMFIVHS